MSFQRSLDWKNVRSGLHIRAEAWFKERKSVIQLEQCVKCKKSIKEKVQLVTCMHSFCKTCVDEHKLCYNRCPMCKKVIDFSKYDEYDGLDLKIPSFDDFTYHE